LGAVLIVAGPARPQQILRAAPRGEPVAETRLIMQGINMPNFHGLEALLQKKSLDTDAWTFARGQALLIAESGNLLLLRPPRGQGRDAWFERSIDLRETATVLARTAANRDLASARTAFSSVAAVCNRCHETFRVKVQLDAPDSRPPVP
jgi:hypothetical protein